MNTSYYANQLRQRKSQVAKLSNDKYFKAVRVYLGIDADLAQLGEYNQMELLAKIKGNLRIGMTYEAWKLLKTLSNRTRDPWVVKQVQILKARAPGEKV